MYLQQITLFPDTLCILLTVTIPRIARLGVTLSPELRSAARVLLDLVVLSREKLHPASRELLPLQVSISPVPRSTAYYTAQYTTHFMTHYTTHVIQRPTPKPTPWPTHPMAYTTAQKTSPHYPTTRNLKSHYPLHRLITQQDTPQATTRSTTRGTLPSVIYGPHLPVVKLTDHSLSHITPCSPLQTTLSTSLRTARLIARPLFGPHWYCDN